jgi:ABC-type branched-subunit amino acid transport system substrate-binding protein
MFAVVGTIAAAATIAAGCGGDDNGTGNGNGEGGFSGTLTIGAIAPLTGSLDAFGGAGEAAVELAASIANDALDDAGMDGRVEVVVEDGQSTDSAAATSAAEKLVRTDNVGCIIGEWASGSTEAVAESVTIDEGVPLISPASTAGAITDLENVYRTVPSDNLQAEVLAQAIADDLGDEGGTISVAALNNTYGEGLASAFEEAATALNLEVNEPVLIAEGADQLDTEAGNLTAGDPDAFVVIAYPGEWQVLGPALARTGNWSADRTWGTDGLRDEGLAGDDNNDGMRGTAPATDETSDIANAFQSAWDDGTDEDRALFDSGNFDAAMLCILAAVKAGSTDAADIADELQAVSGPGGDEVTFEDLSSAFETLADGGEVNYEGVTGAIDWDENGDVTAASYDVWSFTGGSISTDETINLGTDDDGDDVDTTDDTAVQEDDDEDDATMQDTEEDTTTS